MQKSRNLKFDQANKLVLKHAKKQLACHMYRYRVNHLYVDNEVNIETYAVMMKSSLIVPLLVQLQQRLGILIYGIHEKKSTKEQR